MTFGLLTGAEVAPDDFDKLGGFRQPALLKLVFAILGPEVGTCMASAMAQEFDSPTQADRVIGFNEASAFLAWALSGHPDAGELSLQACEIIPGDGPRRLVRPFDNEPVWRDLPQTFAACLLESLRTGAGLSDRLATAGETLYVASGQFSAGATLILWGDGVTVALHFGGLQPGDAVQAFTETASNAVRGIAADARALSVPATPGSLAEEVQTVLASDEAKFSVLH